MSERTEGVLATYVETKKEERGTDNQYSPSEQSYHAGQGWGVL